MKTKITFLLAVLTSLYVQAQVTPVLQHNNLAGGMQYDSNEYDMALYNNEIYFSNAADGTIVKMSLSATNAPLSGVLTGLNYPTGLSVVGDELYFLETYTGNQTQGTGKLSKINLTQSTPTKTLVINGLNLPLELKATAGRAYITEYYLDSEGELDHCQISFINLSGTATKTVLNSQLSYVDDIDLKDNYLYLIEWNEPLSKTYLKRLDITAGTPGTPSIFYTDDTDQSFFKGAISGNKMYLNNDSSPRRLFEIDLTATTPALSAIASGFTLNGNTANPGEIIVAPGNILYVFADSRNGSTTTYILYKVDMNPLSVKDLNIAALKVYPNPATDFITISNIEKSGYGIYSLDGKMVMAGVASKDEKISISHLNVGVYLLKFENGGVFKVLKE